MTVILDSYSETNKDDFLTFETLLGRGQSFTTPNDGISYSLDSFQLYLAKIGTPPAGNMTGYLYAHSGVYGTSSVPTGAALATSTAVNVNVLTGSYVLTSFSFTGVNRISLSPNTHYCIFMGYTNAVDASNSPLLGIDSSGPTSAGNEFRQNPDTSYLAQAGFDACYYVYGVAPAGGSFLLNFI